ncbi:MAG TPA: 2-dehydropantoate 2-reductase [Nocardioidaceae bacterium]|nr:2-dehydropantoate 2-reductase [Nocardioidaceae bacterium]
MRVAVLGAGAIGGYVGAALHRGGADVHLVARNDHLAAIRERGLQVLSPRGDFTAKAPATDDPAEIGPVDYVFLGLKANAYASCGPLIKPLLGENTAVIAAQNGIPWWYFHGLKGPYEDHRIEAVDPGGVVSNTLAPERAIGCVVYPATELAEPGVIQHIEGTRFTIGEPSGGQSDRCVAFSEAMVAGGLKCPVEDDVRNDIWIKLLGNAAFNPISALTRATMVQIARHVGTRATVRLMMEEALEIAAAVGCRPEISVDKRLDGAERVGEHKTSMLQDVEKGKPLELDVILTSVVELADLTGTAAPTIRTVQALTDLLSNTVTGDSVGGASDGGSTSDGGSSQKLVTAGN